MTKGSPPSAAENTKIETTVLLMLKLMSGAELW
jgi:hypothetical protein